MPLLLNVLRNADGPEHKKLRVKAMECAGLIGEFGIWNMVRFLTVVCVAIAVGEEVFKPDAATFVELLVRIQST